MTTRQFDHERAVHEWLEEPIWLPPSDTGRIAQLVHQTPQQRGWLPPAFTERLHTMFSATKFVAAGVIVAALGSIALTSGLLAPQQQPAQVPVGASAPAASETAEASIEPAGSPASEVSDPAADAPAGALVFGPGTGETVGGFTQIGRLGTSGAPYFSELQDLRAFGDVLVARSAVNEADETSRDVLLYSTDGMTWAPASLPSDTPHIADLAVTEGGLVAAGFDTAGGEPRAAMWRSDDGITWAQTSAPPAARIDQIVSTSDPMMVRARNQLWIGEEGGEWVKWNRMPNSSIAQGPNGFLTWQGGGQDGSYTWTFVLHNVDPSTRSTEVQLPDAIDWQAGEPASEDMGIQIFPLDDEWVMVGSESRAPDTIHVSTDGLEWQDVPRPPAMSQGYVRWLSQVGDEVKAFGTLLQVDGAPNALWTWTLGEPAGDAEIVAPSDDVWIDEPVAFQGGYVATGYERDRDSFLTLWRMEGPATE